MSAFNLEIVDGNSSSTCLFVTRNTVHPSPRKNESFFTSRALRASEQWLPPSTSTATRNFGLATSIL